MGDTILVIDDDEEMVQLIQHILEGAGYEVVAAFNGESGLEKFVKTRPDLIILDIMMPKIDGWDVCYRIRNVSSVPIIMLTAFGWHQYVIKGLEAGADDYITKPFDVDELLARVDAVLRRLRMPPPPAHDVPLRIGNDLVIAPDERQLMVSGEAVNLTPTEFELVFFLAKHADRILPTDVIFRNIWPYDTNVNLDRVKWYVSRVRKKIEGDPRRPRYILTEHGIGYRLVP